MMKNRIVFLTVILAALLLTCIAIKANPIENEYLAIKIPCDGCKGTGVSRFSKSYTPTYGTKPVKETCSDCGEYGRRHTHRICFTCGGAGYKIHNTSNSGQISNPPMPSQRSNLVNVGVNCPRCCNPCGAVIDLSLRAGVGKCNYCGFSWVIYI